MFRTAVEVASGSIEKLNAELVAIAPADAALRRQFILVLDSELEIVGHRLGHRNGNASARHRNVFHHAFDNQRAGKRYKRGAVVALNAFALPNAAGHATHPFPLRVEDNAAS